MKSIKHYFPTLRSAVGAMIHGLFNPPRNFRLDMSTYGMPGGGPKPVCFGCAATLTLNKLLPDYITFISEDFQYTEEREETPPLTVYSDQKHHAFNSEDLDEFETAIDQWRAGIVRYLVRIYLKGTQFTLFKKYDDGALRRWSLDNEWYDNLHSRSADKRTEACEEFNRMYKYLDWFESKFPVVDPA